MWGYGVSHVYLLASKPFGTLYAGVTSNLAKCIWQHKAGETKGFASKYGVTGLVWFETHLNIVVAIHREKILKGYKRQWKINLIEALNPNWEDLSGRIYEIDNRFEPKPGYKYYDAYF